MVHATSLTEVGDAQSSCIIFFVSDEPAESAISPKRVWILGAGFSAPLGGPLLTDLFSMKMWRRMTEQFPQFIGGPTSQEAGPLQYQLWVVYLLFHYGRGYPDGQVFSAAPAAPGENRFRDAEDFLAQLQRMDGAALFNYCEVALHSSRGLHTQAAKRWLEGMAAEIGSVKDILIRRTKQLLALECSCFHVELLESEARDGVSEKEAMLPYTEWSSKLDARTDVLISFNYDLVVEKTPGWSGSVPLLKLHGSVDRAVASDDSVVARPASYELLGNGDLTPDISGPGRDKFAALSIRGDLWAKALRHLTTADKVVFLGYGLPESDALAKKLVLEGLRRNEHRYLKVDLVLGEAGFRRRRIEETIRQALAHRVPVDENCEPSKEGDLADSFQHWSEQRLLNLKGKDQWSQDYMQGFAESKESLLDELCRVGDNRMSEQLREIYERFGSEADVRGLLEAFMAIRGI